MAMIVWRETPTASASACCVIWSCSSRRARTPLSRLLPPTSDSPPVEHQRQHQLHDGGDEHQGHQSIGDQYRRAGQRVIEHAADEDLNNDSDDAEAKDKTADTAGTPRDQSVPLVLFLGLARHRDQYVIGDKHDYQQDRQSCRQPEIRCGMKLTSLPQFPGRMKIEDSDYPCGYQRTDRALFVKREIGHWVEFRILMLQTNVKQTLHYVK